MINRSKEETTGGVEANSEKNDKTYVTYATSLTKVTWKGTEVNEEDGYHVFSASDGESNTLPLMSENEAVSVVIGLGATCNYLQLNF